MTSGMSPAEETESSG
jgi:hypothetical protein